MSIDRNNLSKRGAEIARILARAPEILDFAASDELTLLMIELVEGKLSGESLDLALRLKAEDPEASEIHAHLTAAPPLNRVREIASHFSNALTEIYLSLAEPALQAAAQSEIREQRIRIDDFECLLRISRRADRQYDAEFVVPESVLVNPQILSNLTIKIIDKPQPLIFERRSSGNLVANYILPPSLEDPEKEIVIYYEQKERNDEAATDL